MTTSITLANLISKGQQGSLPGNTELNPRKHVEVITLSNGKQLLEREKLVEKEKVEGQKMELDSKSTQLVKEYKPTIPYLAKFNKDCVDDQFSKFLELFKKLLINLPLVEALSQMLKYAKF